MTSRHREADRILDMLAGYATESLTFDTLARITLATATEPGTRIPAVNAVDLLRLVLGIAPIPGNGTLSDTTEEVAAYVEEASANLTAHRANEAIITTRGSGYRVLTPAMPGWPTGLADLGQEAPLILWVDGITDTLTQTTGLVAVTGARVATRYGEHVAADLTTGLIEHGHRIVTGVAYGIEGAAARAALAADAPVVAVLACGIDRAYPAGHTDLLRIISDRGVVLSEHPPGAVPTRERFIRRGRIIAALSVATVIVEAGYRSGALSLARHALGMRRIVAAVPGPVTSAASAGCHRLIQDGETHLVTTADDIATLITARTQ